MSIEVIRTTLAEANRGICGSPNNARYTGRTICWAVIVEGESWIAVNTKRAATAIASYLKTQDLDTVGDPLAAFMNAQFENGSFEDWMHTIREVG